MSGRDLVVQDHLSDQESTGYAHTALSMTMLDQYATEIREQPPFRNEQDKCCDYYDGNQLSSALLDDYDDKGLAPIITNLVKPTVDVVLGMEAKTRSDWRVASDGDQYQPVAEAMSSELHTVERETRADRACSDAYAGQIKAGLGWVEVNKVSNPFAYPYRVTSVHRREMFWDWMRKEPDLGDARYLIRKRWYHKDALCAYMPSYRRLLSAVGSGWDSGWLEMATSSEDTTLAQSLDIERGWTMSDYDWRDTIRGRLMLMEVWYRTWARGYVLKLPDGRVVELDMQNPIHVQAVGRGLVKPVAAVYDKLNKSLWCGPHKLIDKPHRNRSFPYIPFWGYLEDTTGVPYGLVRTMISPQDEVNARKQKLMWLLSARRLMMDSDALDTKQNTVKQVLDELARPDAVIITNPSRMNKQNAISVDSNLQMSEQQFKLLMESKEALQQAAGVYQAMLGATDNSQSGLAISSLVEQGTMTLAEINDNYRYARRAVGESILEMRRADLVGQRVNVLVGEDPKKKTISLNTPKPHPTIPDVTIIDNDVERAKLKVALEDVPSTAAYRQQQQTMLAEVMKGMPPQLQALLAPFYIESTELPKRRQMAQQMRKVLGVPEDDADGNEDPQVATLRQQVMELTAALEQATTAPALKELEAKVEKLIADAALSRAKTAQVEEQTQADKPKRDLETASAALDLAARTEHPAPAEAETV